MMEDLLSYRLSDLLLFSEQTFNRQFVLYRLWLGPFYYLAYLYGALFLFAWSVRHAQMVRILVLITALLWLVCIYGYLHKLYVPINWMVNYLLPVVSFQPLLLLWVGTRLPQATPSYTALALWVAALVLPIIELAAGRPMGALSAYALSPDSLAICTLALMLMLNRSAWLFLPAMLWLVFSALSYLSMENSIAWYLITVLGIGTTAQLKKKSQS